MPQADDVRLVKRFRTVVIALVLTQALTPALLGQTTRWVATWSASPAAQMPSSADLRAAKMYFENQTLREIVHVSAGGENVRVRLSNVYGKSPLGIDDAHIALRETGPDTVAGTDRPLAFSGKQVVTIPANAIVFSDPVALKVPAGSDLVISIYLNKPSVGAAIHYVANATSFIATGNSAAAAKFEPNITVGSWAFLAGVDVKISDSGTSIVAFGDSITDGSRSTSNANHRWPDLLADRLRHAGMTDLSIVNAGIGGNRILRDPAMALYTRAGENALARFERDVLAQPGIGYVIILEGINDLGQPGSPTAPASEAASAPDVIFGLQQLAERAHEHGVKVIGGTITPFAVAVSPGYYTREKDEQRAIVNAWIRTTTEFDAYIDFDKALRNPAAPDRVLPAYDSGDHLHPNDAGYKAMAEAVNLALFKSRQDAPTGKSDAGRPGVHFDDGR